MYIHQYKSSSITSRAVSAMLALFLAMFLVLLSPMAYAKSGTPTINKNGISVWKQPVPNSKVLGFKAKTVIDATPKQIMAVIMDINSYTRWIPRTLSAVNFPEQRENNLPKVYTIIDMPFPLADRELLIASKITQDPNGTVYVTNKLTNVQGVEPNKKFIRVTSYSGTWLLEPNGKKTNVTITGHADMAGGLPKWVANMFVTDQPYEMLYNLKKIVKEPLYQKGKVAYIDIK